MIKYLLVFCCCICAHFSVIAQDSILGNWKGVITQDDGGYRSEYEFELYLKKEDKLITGRSYVYVDEIYAEMALSGFTLNDQIFHFTESKVVRSRKLPQLEWCLKGAALELKRTGSGWELRGRWQGVSNGGNCIPGEIILKKVVPRV
ncbi:hypothetical protein [Flavilitoribacter nigricans]|nr:hypothetical protein [Flavilitoribacter nigricans]